MKIFSSVAKNSFYQFLSRIISSLAVLLVTLMITRNLSRDVWGDFVTVTSYVGLFTIISDFGVNAIFVKEITRNQEKIEHLFGNLLGLRVILSLISIFIALAVLSFLPHSASVKVGIIVGSVLILLQSIFTTASSIFQQKLKYDFFAISDILGSLAIILLVYIASLTNSNLLIIILIFIFGNVVKATISLAFVKKIIGRLRLIFDFNIWKLLITSSLPIGLMLIFSQFNANIDKQIIALTNPDKLGIASSVAVGIYGLSYRVFDLVIALSTFIANSLYPVLLGKLKEDRQEFENLSKRSIAILFLIGLGIGLVGWLLAPVALNIFGKYPESVISLRILILSAPIFFVSSLVLWINITIGKEKLLPFIYAFAMLVNLVLNLAFIPRFGYNFAAWSTVFTEIIILTLLSLLLIYNSETSDVEKAA